MSDDVPDPRWPQLAEQLRRYVGRRVADPHAAEDLVQEVFLKLARQLQHGEPAGPLPAWLFRTAHNAVVDHYRRRPSALPDDGRNDAAPPGAALEDEPLRASLRAFLDGLPAEQREALVQTEFEGLTQKQLAERLGVAVSTVKSRAQRGKKKLERALLDCCSFEFDRRGHLVDWQRRPGGGCRECQ